MENIIPKEMFIWAFLSPFFPMPLRKKNSLLMFPQEILLLWLTDELRYILFLFPGVECINLVLMKGIK
jgi:hypothetical protein